MVYIGSLYFFDMGVWVWAPGSDDRASGRRDVQEDISR